MSVNAADDWKHYAVIMHNEGISWRSIAEELDKPKSTVSDFLRRYTTQHYKEHVQPNETFHIRTMDATPVEDNSRILLISDMHIPYHHPDALEFLQTLKDEVKPTRVICLGDELDKHALSFHDSDPDLPSAGDELRKSLPVVAQLYEMFPEMDILESNHGSLVYRKAKTHGVPRHYIKGYNEVLGVGDGWKWHFDLTITLPNGQKVYFHHGKVSEVQRLSQQMGMNAVQGHFHENFSVKYWGNPTGLYWGLQVGCLIDDDALAFSYNNVNIKRPVIGTAVILDSLPHLVPMVLDETGRWTKRRK